MAGKQGQMERYYVGFDVGSDTVHAAVIDSEGKIVYSPESLMHFGNPIHALKEIYESVLSGLNGQKAAAFAFTGSVGKIISEMKKCPFYFDTIAIPAGVNIIAPWASYIVHIGAKDPYFFERESDGEGLESSYISDHGTGSKCGGGSGILINKQVRRFFAEDFPVKLEISPNGDEGKKERLRRANRKKLQQQIESIHKKAQQEIAGSTKELDVGGRCGVIIQSDMIHMQNSGEQILNILNGMYIRIVRNYKSDVVGTRHLDKNKRTVATGGVFLNNYLIQLFSEQLGINLEQAPHAEKVGAVGAALKALEEGKESVFSADGLEEIIEAQKKEIQFAPPLSSAFDRVRFYPEKEMVTATEKGLIIYQELKNVTEVVIGVDGGSTTTKALIAAVSDLSIIAEICLDTDGKPLETAQKIFAEIRAHLGEKLTIKGIAYTGSSGEFYYKLFTDFNRYPGLPGADLVKDEITCHARGVKHYNSDVDTIFECGGQDAKFTVFNRDGTVRKAKMNLCCMAGTGQSMKNMLDMLGFNYDSFSNYALAAKRTPITDEFCAIFTEAGILKLLALGFPKEEIAAATAYGFMGGYANKFVGNESFGEFASAQGGPFKGNSCLAALALHTGIEIHAFPHRQLFGALGAAIVVYDEIRKVESSGGKTVVRFRGLNLADVKYEKRVENCSVFIKNSCSLRDCRLQIYKIDEDEIFSGGLCPKGNIETSGDRAPNYVELYKKLLNKEIALYAGKVSEIKDTDKPRVLIPRTLSFLNEKGIFFCALYKQLGFDVVVSPESDDDIVNLGFACSNSESCYPAKLQNGHVSYLKSYLRSGKDKMLLLNFIGSEKKMEKTCPYIAAAGFVAKDALNLKDEDVLLPVLYFEDPDYKREDSLYKDLNRLFKKAKGFPRISKKRIRKAVEYADKAQESFNERIYARGSAIVERLKKKGKKVFIGIGRGYTLFDDKASSKIHELFMSYGLHFVPSYFLKRPAYDITNIAHHTYWFQAKEMILYNLLVAMDPQLYGIRETNFNCGPDTFISYHEEHIMDIADKPLLRLMTDGHNSNAQFGTRTLANYEVVKAHKPRTDLKLEDFKTYKPAEDDLVERTMGIPNMGIEGAEILSAIFSSIGYKTEAMPSKTEESDYYARKYLITNNCEPFSIVFGDSLAWVYEKQKQGMDPNKELALLIPEAGGPCRLGQYHVVTRKYLDKIGFSRLPIITPSSFDDWNNIPVPAAKRAKIRTSLSKSITCSDILTNALLRTRPYEKNKGETDRIFRKLHEELLDIVKRGCSLKELKGLSRRAVVEFENISKSNERYPMVSMVGEIFVRCHPGCNQNSIRMLENNRLEVFPRLIADMFIYNTYLQRVCFWKQKYWKGFFRTFVKEVYTNIVTKQLFKPFREYLADRQKKTPPELYKIIQRDNVFHLAIKGEAGISIGEVYEFINGNSAPGVCGVYQLMPFGCMQETVADSKIMTMIQNTRAAATDISQKILPHLNGVFGESELPNLEAEMAMFAEKCYTRKKLTSVK